MKKVSDFKSVVFAGGGSRCFWQLGFWDTAAPAMNIKPDVVAGVSAGAAFACLALAADGKKVLNYFKGLTAANEKNMYLENLFTDKPVFPHYNMFRDAIFYSFDDDVIKKLRSGPDIRILITRPPRWMGVTIAAFTGVMAYNIEKKLFYPLHPVFPQKLGFKPEIISVRDCKSKEDLADLMMQSSCAPPLLPVMKRDGRVVLDGGMIDNVPVFMVRDLPGRKLVLLTRKYKDEIIPKNTDVIYIQPSEPIHIKKWEYTDPDGLQYVYDMGRRDGELFSKQYKN
jgi:predicted patatin/cPLA2 family phospholipase